MRKFFLYLKILLIVFVLGFLHYVLPQHDVVRVTSTEVIRADFSWYNRLFYAQADSGNVEAINRDLRLVNTEQRKAWFLGFFRREATGIMVFRNEDTGWIWPPYLKFDSSDLQAEAAAVIDTSREQWVVLTHYGWRIRPLSIYPNAIGIRKVDGPDVTVVPWFNIFFFIFLAVAWVFLRAAWRQFRERKIDPALETAADKWDVVDGHADAAADRARGLWGRLRAWFGTWRR